MKFASGFGIETEVKLIFPAEFEAGFGEGIVSVLGTGVTFCEVGSVSGEFVGDDPVFDILFVGQA